MDRDLIVGNIRKLCALKGISILKLSKKAGISYRTITATKSHGKENWNSMRIDTLAKIAEVLECTIGDLTDGIVDCELHSPYSCFAYYPYNLIDDIVGEENRFKVYIPGLEKCIEDTLNERERDILLLRYRDKQTLGEIGKKYNLSRERIRTIILASIGKLRSPIHRRLYMFDLEGANYDLQEVNRLLCQENIALREALKSKYLMDDYGVSEWLLKKLETTEDSFYYTPIEELDLTIRAFNCLKRAGIECYGQLAKMTLNDLVGIKNLGRRSAKDVIEKASKHGIYIEIA